jgi:hypothetical protein
MCQRTLHAGVFLGVVLLVEVVRVGEVGVVGGVRGNGAMMAAARISLADLSPSQKCLPPFQIMHLQDFTSRLPLDQRQLLL